MENAKNVLGENLKTCCTSPMTGFTGTGRAKQGQQTPESMWSAPK
jgi:uncharacterized protein (DUF2237 family)